MAVEKIKKLGNIMIFTLIMIYYIEGLILLVLLMLCFSILQIKHGRRLLKRIWMHLTLSALSYLFPKPIFICYNPKIMNKSKNIIISNHLSEFDWLMILTSLIRLERFKNICIVLKDSLQSIPLLGYGMKYFGYIFLNRRIEVDREIIKTGIERLKDNGNFDLLIFPEGTYLDSESIQVTKKYIKKNPCLIDGRDFVPSEVLLPHVTGFDIIRESLNGNADGVIDITLLINPYKKYPQDFYTYLKCLTDFQDRINFVIFLDYVEDFNDVDFIFRKFKEKDHMIKKYKKLEIGEIKSQEEFMIVAKKLEKHTKDCVFDAIFIQSDWSPFFYVFFIFLNLLGLYIAKK
ncbi:acyltransferase [Vairimorpha necatrix]|uniref:Acyltransferase n=1 Tax=Vairimorpha necatrix TaxID=6039 RepID=A0AAX4JE04_9MICR